MSLTTAAPILAALAFFAFALTVAVAPPRSESAPHASAWMFPATICVAFLAWTLYALADEGVIAIWQEISRSLWSNQIFIDLLIAVGVALAFLVPEARRLGMKPLPWVVATAATGCIALLAMLARMLFLQAREASARVP
ncbi:MAG: hypothetical protein F4Y01_03825 [Gammaproteobacteria bacterium]|nr:hypothetical protein [Gammaproteobacteria bacterium]